MMPTDPHYNGGFFELIRNHEVVFFFLAFSLSIFWGVHGVSYGIKEEKKEEDINKNLHDFHKKVILCGYCVSEFVGSLIGWLCLYILSFHMNETHSSISMADVFLVLGAFVGISGWSYRVFDLIKK